MSKKVNWAEVDKRVRDRRAFWASEERQDVEDSLKKLPDVASLAEDITLAQPAVGGDSDDA